MKSYQGFLLKMLASIFAIQAVFLGVAFHHCSSNNHEHCPDIGSRTEQLFSVAIATTLSLLTGFASSSNP
jgi:hypothetical protein